ncbi:Protein of unknown function [Micromonospora lupini str. Lupac 08]|uniref:Uncharacterized protein n=1 Tax=Micromonospora lupini str. Lupac 08 TaxID=1150864 RepID=I0L722_9ACTN|nr:Protein of unknown function [Micromonospora lupini str. Lupac 08]
MSDAFVRRCQSVSEATERAVETINVVHRRHRGSTVPVH